MIEKEVNIRDILEYYTLAGVDETTGAIPFGLEIAENVSKTEVNSEASLRKATTGLAQATVDAVKVARDICEKVSSLEELEKAVENFDGCALKLTASKTVFGEGNSEAKLMLIGEAPGADEDRTGLPFAGLGRELLDKMMKIVGLEKNTYYMSNLLPWRPPGNRTPLASEIAVCIPFLKKQIELVKPDIILVLGGGAANALLENSDPISKLRGKWHEYKSSGGKKIEVLVSFHPSYLLKNSAQKSKAWADLIRLYKKLIQ